MYIFIMKMILTINNATNYVLLSENYYKINKYSLYVKLTCINNLPENIFYIIVYYLFY